MVKVYIDGTEVLCDKNIQIEEEMLNTSSVILNNVFPKTWDANKDYITNFYYPPEYSKCLIYEDIPQRLPDEYQEVEYIESSGTQYIDTGIKLHQNYEVELKISGITYGNTKIFGSRSSATTNNFSVLSTDTSIVCDFYNYSINRLQVLTPITEPITIKMNSSKLSLNSNERVVSSYSSFTTPGNAYIFSGNGTFPAGYTNASMRLHYCKITVEGDTEPVRYFIPCYRKSDEVIGLYDLINNHFYTNAGTGTFTKGYDLPIRNLLFCGIARNTGDISLNPRYPHYCNLQILDFKDFLSQGETLDFVLTDITIKNAISRIVDTVADYGFVVGNINIIGANDVIGAYSTLDKTAYDVFNYLADITHSKWSTRLINEDVVAIDFYDPTLMPEGISIEYTTQFFEDYGINDMSFSYSTNDYRNKQVMTSDEVYGSVEQTQTIIANGYQTQFNTEQKIGEIISITADGTPLSFSTAEQKELGYGADIYYSPGDNYFESENILDVGKVLVIKYIPIVEGRQVIPNQVEINRVATTTGRKGVIARYENRNDATTSTELQKIGQAYIQYKGSPEITLTVESTQDTWNVGEVVEFDAPLDELSTSYLVKKKVIKIVSTVDTVFYTYEMISNFNTENAINYFDNQRAKNSGNIGEGEYITRNVDIENSANIIFYDSDYDSVVPVGNNTLNCTLNSPFVN